MPYRQIIAAAYDAGVDAEYNRLIETPLREAEYRLITGLLDEHVNSGSFVIDVGSGPGRYAEHLLQRNCKIGVVDLSAKSLKAFSDRMENSVCVDNILFNRVSCATQLTWISDEIADAILLMGPLYHLIDEEHRNNALTHCRRILKPGGLLFSVFLSPFPVFNQPIADQTEMKANIVNDAFLGKSAITHTLFQGFKVPQFRCWPDKASEILKSHHFEIIRIRNIEEGTGSFITRERLKDIDASEKKTDMLNQLHATAESESMLGITHQYITVSRRT